jgi:hypothetical protein
VICIDLTQNSIVTSSGLIKIDPDKNTETDVSATHVGILENLKNASGFAISDNKALNLEAAIFYSTDHKGEIQTYWSSDIHFGLHTEKSVLETNSVFKTTQKDRYFVDFAKIDAVERDPKTQKIIKLIANGIETIVPQKLSGPITDDFAAHGQNFVAINDLLSVNAHRLVRIDDENRNKKAVGTTEELHFIFEKGITATSFSTAASAQGEMLERLSNINPMLYQLHTADSQTLEVINLDKITAISHSLSNKDGTGVLDVVDFLSKRKVAVVAPQKELAKLHEASLDRTVRFTDCDLFIAEFFAQTPISKIKPQRYQPADNQKTRTPDPAEASQMMLTGSLRQRLNTIAPEIVTLDAMATAPRSVFTRVQEMAALLEEMSKPIPAQEPEPRSNNIGKPTAPQRKSQRPPPPPPLPAASVQKPSDGTPKPTAPKSKTIR